MDAITPITPDAPDTPTTPRSSRRRRLWELPTLAHELLLGLALPHDVLRRTLAHALGRECNGICRLQGSEADVLFSALHDMGSRNGLSQAVHKLLDSCHTLAVAAWAQVRNPTALRVAFAQGLMDPSRTHDVPGLLWSALSHPCGVDIEDGLLYDMRCWLYQRLRAGQQASAATAALRQDRDRLVRELNQARAANAQAHLQNQLQRLSDNAELARLRGELARAHVGPADVARSAAHASTPRPAKQTTQAMARLESTTATAAATSIAAAKPAPQVAGRKVLCVGGINSAVHRYRALVERLGGHFVHHDGGIEDKLPRLQHQLAGADLVLCQAGCVNHEAYHCVKQHCKRAGTELIFIDRPSLSRFAIALGATV
jgi:Uncharacterized protein conserved in bacteria (DUF2325)